ncbi:MAG: SMP-30/gluconolactonase/LRE family protein [Dehalococcoidia bacterium]
MEIENDRGLSDLLGARQETVLCGGFRFTEGAIWVPAGGFLLFSDIPGNTIFRWSPGETEATPYRRPSRHANGNTLDGEGRLLTCEHSGRQVTVAAVDGPERPLTERYDGMRYNSPNDIVVHSSGAVYFTDPSYGIIAAARGMGEPGAVQEQPVQGVYRIDTDGTVHRVLDHYTQPNGLCFSPDETFLYVNDSQERIINRYRVHPDGSLTDETLFVDMRGDPRRGAPDGMKVDEDGRLWTTGAGGVWVVAADGAALGQFETTEHAANLCFGGPDFRTLFLCTATSMSSIATRVRGIGPGPG